jgi:phosphoglycerate dehydrogenase-like enzyme
MFAAADLAPLRAAAEVVGPMNDCLAGELLRDAIVAITGWGSPRFDEALLVSAPKLRFLAHSAGTVKGIVSDAFYDRGLRISTAASANASPVAETTVAMMAIMLKRIPWLLPSRGDRDLIERIGPIRELRELKIGIISASRVGREVIRMLRSYQQLRVLVYDPYLQPSDAAELGVQIATLEDVCRCEVVTCHAPSVAATHHLLNARTLALLPDHAVLINTARGSLIDEAALVAEVRRRPLYVYLDVTDPEPPAKDSPLRNEPNILLTPHVAGAMSQGRRDMGRLAIDEALRFLAGRALHHEVTREMLPTQA